MYVYPLFFTITQLLHLFLSAPTSFIFIINNEFFPQKSALWLIVAFVVQSCVLLPSVRIHHVISCHQITS